MMLFVGGLATYTFVWELGDISVALMTVFNLIAIIPMGGQAIQALKDYQKIPKDQR
jgi:AGCS family alanine or glycine:cation symporter